LSAVVPFDAQLFGTAANNGQMIAEVQPSGKVAELLLELACAAMGRSEPKRSRATLFDPILSKLARRKAS
jgi:pilus assembly protein CpaE